MKDDEKANQKKRKKRLKGRKNTSEEIKTSVYRCP